MGGAAQNPFITQLKSLKVGQMSSNSSPPSKRFCPGPETNAPPATSDAVSEKLSQFVGFQNVIKESDKIQLGHAPAAEMDGYDCDYDEDDGYEAKFGALIRSAAKIKNTSRFSLSGAAVDHNPHNLQVRASTGSNFVECGRVDELDLDVLKSQCSPAPYGDMVEFKTKVDPAVRLAMECTADNIQFVDKDGKISAGDPFCDSITAQVQEKFLPANHKGKVEVKLHKLNVYGPGGHFKPHRDTPTHDPSTFIGSVVLALPTAFEGGELIVRHSGVENVFYFSKPSADGAVQFAAFYGDCEHEVRPVTAGHRVTLTYSILVADDKVTPTSVLQPPHKSKFLSRLQATDTVKESGHIGFFLSHMYTESGLFAGNLKGADKALYDYLTGEQQIPVSLVPIVCTSTVISPADDCKQYENIKVCLLGGELNDPRSQQHKALSDVLFVDVLNAREQPSSKIDVSVHGTDEAIHCGNHVEDGCMTRVYVKAAMIVGPVPKRDSVDGDGGGDGGGSDDSNNEEDEEAVEEEEDDDDNESE